MLAIEREPGRLSIYDLASLTKRDELTFNASVEYAQFSADGKRLAILTEQQQVYVVDVSRQVLSKN
jgi:Tol biopolymer transport system component